MTKPKKPVDLTNFTSTLQNIDWAMLHVQKQALYEQACIVEPRSVLTNHHLMGIIHLIDHLQDAAVKGRLWSWPDAHLSEQAMLDKTVVAINNATTNEEILRILRDYGTRRPYAR